MHHACGSMVDSRGPLLRGLQLLLVMALAPSQPQPQPAAAKTPAPTQAAQAFGSFIQGSALLFGGPNVGPAPLYYRPVCASDFHIDPISAGRSVALSAGSRTTGHLRCWMEKKVQLM